MGAINVKHTGSGADIALSSDGTSLLLDGTAIGGDPALYRDNASGATTPIAGGTNAVAIGTGSSASGTYGLAIGRGTTASGYDSLALVNTSTASGSDSMAFGSNAVAGPGNFTLALGGDTDATGFASVAIGKDAQSVGSRSTAIGRAYASGADSFAAAIADVTSTYGATGANSIAMGYQAKAAAQSAAMGYSATASGTYSLALGTYAKASASMSIAISAETSGYYTEALQSNSVAIGTRAKADIRGKFVFANGAFGDNGDAQLGIFSLRSDTTDATAEALTTNKSTAGTTNQIILPNNSAYSFSGTIIARQQAADGSNYASWEIKGALLRDANAASTVLGNGIVNKLFATAGASAWAIALTADTTNGGLAITVTGAAGINIRWVATINTSEVTYA